MTLPLKSLRAYIAHRLHPEHYRDMGDLKDRNADLHGQVQAQQSATSITPDELKEISRMREEYTRLCKEQAEIVVYLRDNVPELGTGKYAAMSFSQMIIQLIREGRS